MRFALETASGPVSSRSSRAIRCAGIRTATVPRVSPRSQVSDGCDGRTIGESARPELLHEPLDGLGHLRDECAQRRQAGDEDRRRRLTSAPLRLEQPGDRRRVERVRRDAVHGVGREDDELAPADGLARLTHAGEELRLITAIEDGGHVGPILGLRA